jgi:hypothetical protein
MLLKFVKGFCGLIDTAEAASAVSLKPRNPLPWSHWNRGRGFRGLIETAEADNFKRLSWISWQFWRHIWNGFSPWIRALRGIVWWKNRGSKILWHCPFKHKLYITNKFYTFLLIHFILTNNMFILVKNYIFS